MKNRHACRFFFLHFLAILISVAGFAQSADISSPLRSLMSDGILVGISPDGTTNPFWDIMIITSQQANPNENITIEQAVIAYTKANAYAEFKEKEKGMLVKGMLADLAVLSQDIFTIPKQQLPATTSMLTMIDGKIVYQQVSK